MDALVGRYADANIATFDGAALERFERFPAEAFAATERLRTRALSESLRAARIAAGSDAPVASLSDLQQVLGADEAIDYKTEDVAARVKALTDGRGVDLVHELVVSANLPTDFKLLAKGGRIVCTGQGPAPEVSLPIGVPSLGAMNA